MIDFMNIATLEATARRSVEVIANEMRDARRADLDRAPVAVAIPAPTPAAAGRAVCPAPCGSPAEA